MVGWLDEHACPLLTADKMWSPHISGLVRKHETPLITVRQYGVDQQVEISVVAAEKLYLSGNRIWNRLFNNAATILGIYAGSPYRMNITIPYVCISHVWAELVSW
jgi:hypothetical protein